MNQLHNFIVCDGPDTVSSFFTTEALESWLRANRGNWSVFQRVGDLTTGIRWEPVQVEQIDCGIGVMTVCAPDYNRGTEASVSAVINELLSN